MSRFSSKLVLAAVMLWSANAGAAAYPTADAFRPGSPLPVATALADTAPTLAPLAFVQFCLSNQEQCGDPASASSITLDAQSWSALQRVNADVNDAITPDASKGGYDWSLETRLGNCNDYAIQKRHALIKLGYPAAALSLAVVKTAFGEGHLVLTARTDRGDFVLDNRRSTIVAWNRTGYRWIKRQSAENPLQWVSVSDRPEPRSARAAARLPAIASAANGGAEIADKAAIALPIEPVPLPTIGLAAKRLDASLFGPVLQGSHSFAATITHVAAGRQLAMLAFDELRPWYL
jgi:predicted transglutaminase-like cysteine proteinase